MTHITYNINNSIFDLRVLGVWYTLLLSLSSSFLRTQIVGLYFSSSSFALRVVYLFIYLFIYLFSKNGVLPVIALLFWNLSLSLKASYKELIWCTIDPNVYIPLFCNCWSFIWQSFFPVSTFTKQVQNNWNGCFSDFIDLQEKTGLADLV